MNYINPDFFTSFNNVKYYDEPHKYYLNDGRECISVTTLIHKYVKEFDEDYWSEYKAKELNKTKDEIISNWRLINKIGTFKGTLIHNYGENLFQNKIFKYPESDIINEFGSDILKDEYLKTKNHVDDFYKDTKGKLIPIKQELIVYDEESLIAGMVDMVFYNVKANEYQIWDYKTNKKLTTENKYQNLLNPLFDLSESDINIYSLQLSLYKYIIEKIHQ